MRRCVLLLLPIITIPFAMGEAQPAIEREPLILALKAVRADLPRAGRIALVAKGGVATRDDTVMAMALGLEAHPMSALRECVPSTLKTGRRESCRLRGAVGALRVEGSKSTGDKSMRVQVMSVVPMTAKDIAPWLYTRVYAVDLVRTSGEWQVVAKRVMSES